MVLSLILIFVIGYLCIAMEHELGINKAAFALLMGGAMWTAYILAGMFGGTVAPEAVNASLVGQLGDTCEILIFLIGAMTIVDLVDSHGGFDVITGRITTRNKRKLLWLLAGITFLLSSVLDNMTTTIIMVMLLRRIVPEQQDRWIFAAVVVMAANSGGAWSPIGDVTTIMLWMKGNVTALKLMEALFLPCIVSLAVPAAIASGMVSGRIAEGSPGVSGDAAASALGPKFRLTILSAGVGSLLLVPVFKAVTGLPPYMGMMIVLGLLWIMTEIVYDRRQGMDESRKYRVSRALGHIDMSTILFFLGILLAVAALQSSGILAGFAHALDSRTHDVFLICGSIGVLSSVIDNVPLVAACMGMYPVATEAAVSSAANPEFMRLFMPDGLFWQLLAYCAGIGGSMLIIGSAAGVVAMGLEKMTFAWYCRRMSLPALAGYLAGIAVIWLESIL